MDEMRRYMHQSYDSILIWAYCQFIRNNAKCYMVVLFLTSLPSDMNCVMKTVIRTVNYFKC